LVETFPAIYRLVAAGLKRDLSLLATSSAGCGIHLAGSSIIVAAAFITKTLSPFGSSARSAAFGFIGEAFGSEEFLLFDRKGEGFAAIAALKVFFCVSH
jgi:hypothetical protein